MFEDEVEDDSDVEDDSAEKDSEKGMMWVRSLGNISKDDVINGFIRDIQSLVPYKNNPYYIIQKDIIVICKSYIFWYRSDAMNDIIARNDIYIDPVIIKQARLFDDQFRMSPMGELLQIMINRFSYVLSIPITLLIALIL